MFSRQHWWFQTEPKRARYGADDEVAVTVEDGAVVLTFPSTYVGDATALRWSIASEWGPYAAIGTRAMARDYAPDDRSGATWPE